MANQCFTDEKINEHRKIRGKSKIVKNDHLAMLLNICRFLGTHMSLNERGVCGANFPLKTFFFLQYS